MPQQHAANMSCGNAAALPTQSVNRRRRPERRRTTWRTFALGAVRARRRHSRRDADEHHFLDWHEAYLLIPVVSILLLSVADALLTLKILSPGGSQVNPVMAWLLETNIRWFAIGKMAFTGLGVLVLVAVSRARVFRVLRVANVLHWFFAAYVALIGYEWVLLNQAIS
jgi:hypothetical protein